MRLLFILAFGLLTVGLVCNSVLFVSATVYKDKETYFSKSFINTVLNITLVCLAVSSFSWSIIILKILFSILTTFN